MAGVWPPLRLQPEGLGISKATLQALDKTGTWPALQSLAGTGPAWPASGHVVPVALTGDHVVWEEGAGRQVVSVSLTRKSWEFVLLDSPYLTDPEAAVCLGGRGGVWGIPVTA